MKQNNNPNMIATTVIALFLAVMSAVAAGAVTVANVDFPADIAIDGARNIYVADTGNNTIQVLNSAGALLRTVGSGIIDYPGGVAVDSTGNIYVADDSNNSIKVFNSTTGVLVKTIGQLNSPEGVAVDSAGIVYVADSGNNSIKIFNPAGALVQTVGIGQLNFPGGVTADSAGNVYVADSGNNRIMKFNSTGFLMQTIGGFNFPNDVDVTSAGTIYVTDTGNDSIKVLNPDGSLNQSIGTRGAGDGQFDLPMGVAVDSAGNIYVADGNNNRIQAIAPTVVPAIMANITAFDVGNGNRAGTIRANVTVMNLGSVPHKFAAVVSGVNQRGFPLAGTGVVVNLNPGQSVRIPVQVTVPPSADVGSYSLLAGVFPFDNEVLDPASLIGNLTGPGTATVS